MEPILKTVLLVIPIIALTIWVIVILERRDKANTAARMSDPTIFKATASIEGTQGTIADVEFGGRLEALIAEAKAKGFRGIDVAWLNRAGKPVNRTVIDFTR